MDDDLFPNNNNNNDGLYWISEDALCVCGDIWCLNISDLKEFESLTHATKEEEEKMHEALKSQDCGQVCQLLQSGMRLCCNGEDNCFANIVKFWKFPFINSVLKLHPSAIDCHGPGGNTLLMLSDNVMKLEVVMRCGPDLTAVNDEGDNWLHHAMKHRLHTSGMLKTFTFPSGGDDIYYTYLCENEAQTLLKESKAMIEFIVNSGIDVNSVDAKGETALQVVLKLFKCGYVFNQFHAYHAKRAHHEQELCAMDNESASHALSQLLKANATIPPPDDFGRTALMMAALSPWNTDNMMLLIDRGVDVAAKDQNGFNAIFYLLSSFAQHYHWNCITTFYQKSSAIDKMTSILFKMGCEIQGTDIIMFTLRNGTDTIRERFKVITHLLTLKDSELNQCDFPQKLALKNEPENDTFLEVFLNNRKWKYHLTNGLWNFEMNDVAVIEKELSEGLKVIPRWPTSEKCTDVSKEWCRKLCVPNAIRILIFSHFVIIWEEGVYTIVPDEIYYPTLEGIQRLVLPFWPHPPLALVLICYYCDTFGRPDIVIRKRLFEFLFDVGGPLSPGSELYIAVKNTLEFAAQITPLFAELLDLFLSFHSEVPTLQQLARTALRGSFKFDRTDTVGLDLSSLRVQWQGRMLVLPQLIKNFINFKPLLYKPSNKA